MHACRWQGVGITFLLVLPKRKVSLTFSVEGMRADVRFGAASDLTQEGQPTSPQCRLAPNGPSSGPFAGAMMMQALHRKELPR